VIRAQGASFVLIFGLIFPDIKAPKSLGIFWVIGEHYFLVGFWMGAGHQKDQVVIRNLEFLAPPLIFQRGAGNGVNN